MKFRPKKKKVFQLPLNVAGVLMPDKKEKKIIVNTYNQACHDWEKFLPDVNETFDLILTTKYPGGLPLLPNSTGGANLKDVYPDEYKLAKAVIKRLEGEPGKKGG